MSLGPYQVDEFPTRPIVIDVSDQDGLLDLTEYNNITFESNPYIPGFISTDPDFPGRVQINVQAPFSSAGEYSLRLKFNAGPRVDMTPWLSFDVTGVNADSQAGSSPILSPDEAYRITGETVSNRDITKATSFIGLILDRDLQNTYWWDNLSLADQRRLKAAIAFWAAEPVSGVIGTGYAANVSSVSSGDQSISFQANANTQDIAIPPKVFMALRKLSWLNTNNKNEYLAPFIEDYPAANDYLVAKWWNNEAAFNAPIIRGLPTDDMLWHTVESGIRGDNI